MKYDWASRSAATIAITSVAAYYSWRGFSGHLLVFFFVANIVAIAITSIFSRKNLRRHLAILIALQCVEVGFLFLTEFRCCPSSICTALSGVVLAVNIGVLVFLLMPVQSVSNEV
jgi:hypothetical protein